MQSTPQDRRSRIAILVAGAAVVFALVGTALAGPEAIVRAVSKSQVKKIAKKQANAVLDSRAANLNVNSAKTAASAEDSAKLGGQPPGAYASSKVEAYHEIGSPGEPVFSAGWANDPSPGIATAAFYKDPFEVVHLKGQVVRSGGTGVIFVLPPGYRPAQVTCMPTVLGSGPAATSVCAFTTGELSGSAGSGTFLLNGLSFRAG